MGTVDVRPESIHLAAEQVSGSGQDSGESVGQLSTDMGSADGAYGGDELGSALRAMYDIIGPKALQYFTETGFCLVETGVALDQVATEYTAVESDNTGQVNRVQEIIDSLGEV